MKKFIHALALALALCFVLSLAAFAGDGPDSGFAQVDETHWAGSRLSIQSVEIADEYADYVDSTWFVNITKIVYDGGVIDVDNEKYTAILTVDGVQRDLFNAADESFEGDVVITLVEKDASVNTGNAKFGDDAGSLIGTFYYTAATYFNEDGYQENSSVAAAQNGASVNDSSVTGMEYVSNGDYFSGVFANAGNVTVSDSSFTAIGRGGDDFTGQGNSVVASGEAHVTIQGCTFNSQGALRTAIWSGGSSHVDVIDTVVQTLNDEELVAYNTEDNYATQMMQQTPFALGLTGNVRATLLLSQAEMTFRNCLIASNGWAVLSTDSGNGTLNAIDTTTVLGYVEPAREGAEYDEICTVNGVEYGVTYGRAGSESGYTAFGAGFNDNIYGGRFFAPDYLFIITDGSVTIGASEKGRFYGWCDRIGFMSNAPGRNTKLTISESDFEIRDTFALVKTKGGNCEAVTLSDVNIDLTGGDPWGGNLLELIDSDDLGGGPGATTYTIPYSTYDEYLAAESGGEGAVTSLNIADSELTGNVFNSVGSQTGSQTAFRGDSIAVSLDSASLTGVVSSAYGVHCTEDGRVLTGELTVDSYGREGTYDYLTLGRILNYAAPTVNNTVTLALTNSTWNCTGLSYLASLTLDAGSVVNGDVYQDGELVELQAGTYENVVVVPAGADYDETVAAGVAAIEADAADGVVPADRSELVANTDLGIGGMFSGMFSDEASGEASGNASVQASDGASGETTGEAS